MQTCGITYNDFSKEFNKNMSALGLPVPESLFSTAATAIANTSALIEAAKIAGSKATISEVIGASYGLEKLKVAGALLASYYVGAVVGSIGVAVYKGGNCGISLRQLQTLQNKHNLMFPYSHQFYLQNPEVLSPNKNSSTTYWTKAIKK